MISELAKISFTREQAAALKHYIMMDSDVAERVSLGLAIRLATSIAEIGEDFVIRAQIMRLERNETGGTKVSTQFRHPPLHPFWHQHFSSTRHTVRNIGLHWGLTSPRSKKQDNLDKMISAVADLYGHDPDLWPKALTYRLGMGLQERSEGNELTGDWIIFAKYQEQNYYLDVVTHEEAKQPEKLIEKLRASSAADFSFLF